MTTHKPRLRMFAGPNGSGKTTIKLSLNRPDSWFGIYFNADDIEKELCTTKGFSVAAFGLMFTFEDLRKFFAESVFLQEHKLAADAVDALRFANGFIQFSDLKVTSYHASVLADFLRRSALANKRSFTFETVMSAVDKVHLLQNSQKAGFRTYLYFVATEDPQINVARVRNRVAEGGHDVPEDKIVSRYYRTLSLLPDALRFANRAFLFDSSGEDPWYFAEVTDGQRIELKEELIPGWFENAWKNL